MSDDEAIRGKVIVQDLASIDPAVTSEYPCSFGGAGDPVDRPLILANDCLHLRATRWTERRWGRDEGWRVDALRRLGTVQDQLRQGKPASQGHVERILAALEASLDDAD